MVPVLAPERPDTPDADLTEDDFALDLRVVESTSPLVMMMCATSDGCGSTCSTSACSSRSADPA